MPGPRVWIGPSSMLCQHNYQRTGQRNRALFLHSGICKISAATFCPWLARAAEGPTPSSAGFYGAIMVHAGVYLMLLLQPIFERAPLVMALVAVVGLLTAVYGFIVGLTQTDVKSSLFFATTGQLGLMFLECGLGFWHWQRWHLCAHAVVRGYQVLIAPSLMHNIHRQSHKACFTRLSETCAGCTLHLCNVSGSIRLPTGLW